MRRFQLRKARTNYERQRWVRTDDFAPRLPGFGFMHIFNLARKRSAKRFVWVDVNNMLNTLAEIFPDSPDNGIDELIAVLDWFG